MAKLDESWDQIHAIQVLGIWDLGLRISGRANEIQFRSPNR